MFSAEKELDPAQFFGISGQGLGIFLLGKGQNVYFLYPGYNTPGATCVLIASPVMGRGAVIMTNSATGLQLSLEVLAAIANEYGWRPVQ
jgi:hypothetical protein